MTHSVENNQEPIVLSRAELSYLMEMLNAQTMVGLDTLGEDFWHAYDGNRDRVIKQGRSSLIQRGFILSGENGANDKVEGKLLKCAITSFFPNSALVVVRNLPRLGEQVLIFFRYDDYILLHTFPEKFSHRMEALDHPDQVLDILLEWFPLHQYPKAKAHLRMSVDRFEEIQELVERRDVDRALEVLIDQPVGDEEKLNLIRAIENRAVSGAFAVQYLSGEVIRDAISMAAFADVKTAWVLEQPKDDPEGQWILVKRVGPDFVKVMSALIEMWLKSEPE